MPEIQPHYHVQQSIRLTEYTKRVITYIAGHVVHAIITSENCTLTNKTWCKFAERADQLVVLQQQIAKTSKSHFNDSFAMRRRALKINHISWIIRNQSERCLMFAAMSDVHQQPPIFAVPPPDYP